VALAVACFTFNITFNARIFDSETLNFLIRKVLKTGWLTLIL